MLYDITVACRFVQDKWRNLLKASGMQEQGSQQVMHFCLSSPTIAMAQHFKLKLGV